MTTTTIANPKESLTMAYAHAMSTSQWDFCTMVESLMDEFNDLCCALVADGSLAEPGDDGFAGAKYQALIESGFAKTGDARFARLVEMTKSRFLVNVESDKMVSLN